MVSEKDTFHIGQDDTKRINITGETVFKCPHCKEEIEYATTYGWESHSCSGTVPISPSGEVIWEDSEVEDYDMNDSGTDELNCPKCGGSLWDATH